MAAALAASIELPAAAAALLVETLWMRHVVSSEGFSHRLASEMRHWQWRGRRLDDCWKRWRWPWCMRRLGPSMDEWVRSTLQEVLAPRRPTYAGYCC